MVTIIHGDDIVLSRKYLQEQKQKTHDPYVFDGLIDITTLIQITQGNALFSTEKNVFVENFFSKNKLNSPIVIDIINYINKNESLFEIFFWEANVLQKKSLNLLNKPKIKIFKIPQVIFLFLDNIKPANFKSSITLFHKALQNTVAELIFFMLQRQFRLLLAISDENATAASDAAKKTIDEVLRLAPWQKGKFERQAKLFSIGELKYIYKSLYEIELAQKTGNLPYSLAYAIDFLLLNI